MSRRTSSAKPSTQPSGDTTPPLSSALHTPAEAAELLAVPESWLRRKASRRSIPCTFVGKHLRFTSNDLDEIIRSGHRDTTRRRHPHHRT